MIKRNLCLTIPPGLTAILLIIIALLAQSSARAAIGMGGDKSNTEQDGPPWYDGAWYYRREVVVTNGGNSLPYYQVLVKLTAGNFDFNRAKADGSDLRFTHSDGTTELKFWIESWNRANQLAYIWVRVPSLASGDTVIYMYYSNSNASAISDGTTSFDFFDDDWSSIGGTCTEGQRQQSLQPDDFDQPWGAGYGLTSVPCLWQVLAGTPITTSGILTLPEGTGIRTVNSYQYKAVGFRANYEWGTGREWAGFINGDSGPRTMIGDLPGRVDELFLINRVTGDETILLSGQDWHEAYHNYEVRWSNGQSRADVDHGASSVSSTQPEQVPTSQLPITFYSASGSNADLRVDYVYIRQYRYPEPSVSLGLEQGYIDLAIGISDSPDPLYAGEALTYQLTIANTSSVDAARVVVTDTLPVNILPASVDPSQGDCSFFSGSVVCSLGNVPALSAASVTVVVTTTMDGNLNNLAYVGSPGYDSNMSNDTAEAITTVIPSADIRVSAQGAPEALLPGGILVYHITVTNQGPSNAMGVSLENTLPEQVNFVGMDPESCTLNGLEVTCPLGDFTQADETHVVITTTVDMIETMELMNSALASSLSTHDPDLVNNTSVAHNLVDTTPPEISWERPVQNEGVFVSHGELVTLETLVIDNDQVEIVKYKYYDHLNPNPDPTKRYVPVGDVYDPPYIISFESNVLKPGELYQLYAYAYDRAGNWSRQRIIIKRMIPVYIPLVLK